MLMCFCASVTSTLVLGNDNRQHHLSRVHADLKIKRRLIAKTHVGLGNATKFLGGGGHLSKYVLSSHRLISRHLIENQTTSNPRKSLVNSHSRFNLVDLWHSLATLEDYDSLKDPSDGQMLWYI